MQTALDRGDVDVAVSTVLSLARRGFAGAGRAAAVLAAGGHLEGREQGLATELLANALAHCPDGELPSLLDRWVAVDRGASASSWAQDDINSVSDSDALAGRVRATAAGRPSAGWLARRLRECFLQAGAGAARGLALLPQLADAHFALAVVAAMGLQPAMAALESALSDGTGSGVPARAALLLGMYATGVHALESTDDLRDDNNDVGLDAVTRRVRQRLMLSPWAVLRHVRQLPNQLRNDLEATRADCLQYERCSLWQTTFFEYGSLYPCA